MQDPVCFLRNSHDNLRRDFALVVEQARTSTWPQIRIATIRFLFALSERIHAEEELIFDLMEEGAEIRQWRGQRTHEHLQLLNQLQKWYNAAESENMEQYCAEAARLQQLWSHHEMQENPHFYQHCQQISRPAGEALVANLLGFHIAFVEGKHIGNLRPE